MSSQVQTLQASILLCCVATFAFEVTAQADVIHVPGDYPTIKQAIGAAGPGSTILVAPGTYTGPGNRNLDFGGIDIEIRSEKGADVTIIDCEEAHPGLGFYFHSGETSASIVDGFTITRGGPVGIRCRDSSPTIRNCTISWSANGGMICDRSAPIVENCTFLLNGDEAGSPPIGCYNESSLTVTNCAFIRNNPWGFGGGLGGGIYAVSSSLSVTGCLFVDNPAEGGGGIYCRRCSLAVTNSHFQQNSSDNNGGSGILCSAPLSATITGCTFIGNIGSHGVGLSGEATITNCTFVGNGPGSQVSVTANSTIDRTIIAFGKGKGIECWQGAAPTLRCCDIFGNAGGDWIECIAGQQNVEGNFAADPLFCNIGLGDLTLNVESPCLPGNHPQGVECGLIGAWGPGCGTTPVQAATWGQIKAVFER